MFAFNSRVLFPVDGGWTPWSVWSDCSVTCGRGTQVRTHACINPPPRNNGSDCSGPERETQECHAPPCLGLFTISESPIAISIRHGGVCVSCFLYRPQMTFAPGRHGHRAPVAAAPAPCQGVGSVCARRRGTRPVLPRSRPRITARRLSCVSSGPVQVRDSANGTFLAAVSLI